MRAQIPFCILLVSLICRGSSTPANMYKIAIRSANLNLTDSYRSVLVPHNWKLQLVCTCVIDAVINCPSANFRWMLDTNLRDVTPSQPVPGDPTRLTISNVNWPNAISDTKCVQEAEAVKLDIAIFNLTAQNAAIKELNKPSNLQCILRSTDPTVLSEMRVSWYRQVPQSDAVDGADTAEDVNLNAAAEVDSKWTTILLTEQLSQKDTTLRYTRTDVNTTVSYQSPNSSLIGSNSATHYLLVSTLHITRASREDVGTYRCMYTYDYKNDNTPRPIETWTRTAYANLRLFSKPFKAGPATQSEGAKQDESLIVTEGAAFTVECNVFGSPMPRVTSWSLRDTSSGSSYELFSVTSTNLTRNSTLPLNVDVEDLRGIQNGRLRVLSATYAHRGRYECVAENAHGQTQFAWLVRVKSKYAFIYPLVGIVIELLVLAFLIIMYERRKAKASAKTDDGSLSSAEEPAATSTNGGSHQAELRYRVA